MTDVIPARRKMINDLSVASRVDASLIFFQPVHTKEAPPIKEIKEIYTGSCRNESGRPCF
jgi:hypothetical protein